MTREEFKSKVKFSQVKIGSRIQLIAEVPLKITMTLSDQVMPDTILGLKSSAAERLTETVFGHAPLP